MSYTQRSPPEPLVLGPRTKGLNTVRCGCSGLTDLGNLKAVVDKAQVLMSQLSVIDWGLTGSPHEALNITAEDSAGLPCP